MTKYTGNELANTDLSTAQDFVEYYQDNKNDLTSISPMNYAFFSTTALARMLEFCENNPTVKGIKFNLVLLPKDFDLGEVPTGAPDPDVVLLSLVTWPVDEDGIPVSATESTEDGDATQYSAWPCPEYCIPPT